MAGARACALDAGLEALAVPLQAHGPRATTPLCMPSRAVPSHDFVLERVRVSSLDRCARPFQTRFIRGYSLAAAAHTSGGAVAIRSEAVAVHFDAL